MGSRVPGALIASGRACDVFEYGPGRVLRAYREGEHCDPEREAAVMRHAAAAGIRVPRVLEVRPRALVLERVEGPTMLERIEARPLRFARYARELGRLHRQILDAGLVHRDFHPLNVILGAEGPVVIDWSNGGEGEAAAEVAFSQVILATSEAGFPGWLERLARAVRRRFVDAYLEGVGIEPPVEAIAAAAERRLLDPHLQEAEQAAVRRLLERLQPSTK